MSVFQGSDLTSWYNRLNAVRQKQNINLGTVAVPTVTGQPAKASDLTSLRDIILGMKSNTYLSYANYTGIDSLDVQSGRPTLQADFDIIDSAMESLEGICGNNSTQTDSTNSTCTTTRDTTTKDQTSYNDVRDYTSGCRTDNYSSGNLTNMTNDTQGNSRNNTDITWSGAPDYLDYTIDRDEAHNGTCLTCSTNRVSSGDLTSSDTTSYNNTSRDHTTTNETTTNRTNTCSTMSNITYGVTG